MFKPKSMYVFYFILSCGFEQRICRYAIVKVRSLASVFLFLLTVQSHTNFLKVL
ncbi:hypothetical protein HanIR_Chr14g0691001 [Helianthus annuus]|nr:hypothetical protein HanIR_Chr14g0691001 [Helianthus annuus]